MPQHHPNPHAPNPADQAAEAHQQNQFLHDFIEPLLNQAGYDLVALEMGVSRGKLLRVYIDHLDPEAPAIGLEDCVTVTKLLNDPLDQSHEVERIFHGAYELEVSSPGIDRPLQRLKDFERFKGSEAEIHTNRTLTGPEIENTSYIADNPKQKKFLGKLAGTRGQKVLIHCTARGGVQAELAIPLELITKAKRVVGDLFETTKPGGKKKKH